MFTQIPQHHFLHPIHWKVIKVICIVPDISLDMHMLPVLRADIYQDHMLPLILTVTNHAPLLIRYVRLSQFCHEDIVMKDISNENTVINDLLWKINRLVLVTYRCNYVLWNHRLWTILLSIKIFNRDEGLIDTSVILCRQTAYTL